MIKYLFIWLIFSILYHSVQTQQAIIFTSSLGFFNIRQNSNVVKIYHHIKSNGIRDQNILLLFSELQPCCQKNPKFGTLSFYDGDYTNIFHNIEVDYYQSELTDLSVSNILSFQYPKYTLNKRKLRRDNRKQPVFVYVAGHGGDFYFKIRERMALLDEQFMITFDHLEHKNITEQIVLFSDSCSAITPFQTIKKDKFLALASSSFDQKSLSHGSDIQMYGPKTDDFSFYFDQILKMQYDKPWTFQDVLEYMDFSKLKVNSKIYKNNLTEKTKLQKFIKKKKGSTYHKYQSNKKFSDCFI